MPPGWQHIVAHDVVPSRGGYQRRPPVDDPRFPAPSRLSALRHRWPTAFAVLLALATAGDDGNGSITGLAEALVLFPLGYLLASVIGRPSLTWWLAGGAVTALASLRLQSAVEPAAVLLAAGVALVAWASIVNRGRPSWPVTVEAAGFAGFAALALSALAAGGDVGVWIVALGWLGHAGWDWWHHRAGTVVSRSFAEWCGVFDALGALGIVGVAMFA